MKEKADVVRGWLRKAASDIVTVEAALGAGSLDGACFHAQQAAEKYLFWPFMTSRFLIPTIWVISPNYATTSTFRSAR